MPRRAAAAALAAAVLAGCGSAGTAELPPAAEPRDSPPLEQAPAGKIVRVGPPITTLTEGRTTPPGGAPEGLAVQDGVLAVGVRRPAQLVLLDAATLRVRDRVALPAGPRHLAAGGGVFAVPAEMADRVLAVRADDGRVLYDVAAPGRPHAVAMTRDGVAVGEESGNHVRILDARGGIVEREPVATQPGGLAALADGRLAVVSVRERVVELLPGGERAGAGVGPTHAVTDGEWLWVTDTQGDALLVFRLEPDLRLVRRLYLAEGPYGIALDTGRRRLWVTLTGSNELVELPAHGRPHVLRTFPTVRQPYDVAVDSATGRVFVGGRADGVVQALDPDDPDER